MNSPKINQFVPSVHTLDAVGATSLELHRLCTDWGWQSQVYALYRDAELADEVRLFTPETAPKVDDAINILHFALPSPLTDFFIHCGGKQVVIFHNITPPYFFRGYNEELVDFTAQGYAELHQLTALHPITVAYSTFSANDLRNHGFLNPPPRVLPFLINWERYDVPNNPVIESILTDGWVNLLFVGRPVPNKRQDRLVKILAAYRSLYNAKTRLILVGRGREGDRYLQQVLRISTLLHNQPLWLTGRVSQRELATIYRCSHLFLCLSEHEGFGVPLVESMYYETPILALEKAAVPDTLGGAGVLIKKNDTFLIAGMMHKILSEPPFKKQILLNQNKRLSAFMPPNTWRQWKQFLTSLC